MAPNVKNVFERHEKKYLLDEEKYRSVTSVLERYMVPDAYGQYSLMSLYFDTDSYELIRSSIEKPAYKEKLRVRSYGVPGDDDMVFVELKKKFKGVVYKRRVQMTNREAREYLINGRRPARDCQILREIDWFLSFYSPKPSVLISYDREAFSGMEDPELRITFDRSLRWRQDALDPRLGSWGEPLLPQNAVLMEIKANGAAPLWLAHMLSELEVFSSSFSKYGTCYKEDILNVPSPGKYLENGVIHCA